jgi:rare lipoprotein A
MFTDRARITVGRVPGALALMLFAAGCARHATAPLPARIGSSESGIASWYGVPYHGRPTASGEIFDMERLTAAHRALPFETWVEVTNLSNGKQVDVRITDRGPFVRGRIIDLSLAAARQIDMVRTGTARVRLKVIDAPVTIPAATAVTPDAPPIPAHPAKALVTAPARAGDYAVQVGAFVDPSRAEALRANLPYSDARVVQPPGDRQGSPPLWRVWVGHALTLPEATALAADVEQTTGAAIVVREDATQ